MSTTKRQIQVKAQPLEIFTKPEAHPAVLQKIPVPHVVFAIDLNNHHGHENKNQLMKLIYQLKVCLLMKS